MENPQIAKEMLRKSVARIFEVKLFGNGYPFGYSMKEPKMVVEENYTMVYDSFEAVSGKKMKRKGEGPSDIEK